MLGFFNNMAKLSCRNCTWLDDDQKILRCVFLGDKCRFDWSFLIGATFLFQDSKTSLLQFIKIRICEYHFEVSRENNLYIYKHSLEFFAELQISLREANFLRCL